MQGTNIFFCCDCGCNMIHPSVRAKCCRVACACRNDYVPFCNRCFLARSEIQVEKDVKVEFIQNYGLVIPSTIPFPSQDYVPKEEEKYLQAIEFKEESKVRKFGVFCNECTSNPFIYTRILREYWNSRLYSLSNHSNSSQLVEKLLLLHELAFDKGTEAFFRRSAVQMPTLKGKKVSY